MFHSWHICSFLLHSTTSRIFHSFLHLWLSLWLFYIDSVRLPYLHIPWFHSCVILFIHKLIYDWFSMILSWSTVFIHPLSRLLWKWFIGCLLPIRWPLTVIRFKFQTSSVIRRCLQVAAKSHHRGWYRKIVRWVEPRFLRTSVL